MNTVAKNQCVRLQQELVEVLRATGSIKGAEQFWRRLNFNKPLGKKLACYGFQKGERQLLINKVAFPDVNFIEVFESGEQPPSALQARLRLRFDCARFKRPIQSREQRSNDNLDTTMVSYLSPESRRLEPTFYVFPPVSKIASNPQSRSTGE